MLKAKSKLSVAKTLIEVAHERINPRPAFGVCLRTRPIATGFVDRRSRRLGQMFRGLEQATVQTFVAQIGAGKLLRLDRLCADLNDSLHVGVLASRRRSQSARHCSSPIATGV